MIGRLEGWIMVVFMRSPSNSPARSHIFITETILRKHEEQIKSPESPKQSSAVGNTDLASCLSNPIYWPAITSGARPIRAPRATGGRLSGLSGSGRLFHFTQATGDRRAVRARETDKDRSSSRIDRVREMRGAINYFFSGHPLKLQLDVGKISEHREPAGSRDRDTVETRLQFQVILPGASLFEMGSLSNSIVNSKDAHHKKSRHELTTPPQSYNRCE
jgi:hypothetical protein